MKALAASPSPPAPRELDALGDRIAELSAHIQAATFRLLTLIREFDQREGWHAHGARSCAHWLAWRTGLDLGAAREKVRVARALADLPTIGAAMSRGEISYSKVRALTRVATPENEKELLGFARAGTASHVERLIRAWRRTDRLEEAQVAERRHDHRYVRAYTDEDGMLVVRARLEPEAGAMLLKALDAAQDRLHRSGTAPASPPGNGETLPGKPEPDHDQKRADALALVAECALGRGLSGAEATTGGDHHQVVVHVDAKALVEGNETGHAALEGGCNVSAETSRRISCDASKVVMKHGDDGRILDVGRKTRTVPPAIRRALAFRDRGCRFPGCGVRVCDAHHVRHWADGGATRLDNLVLLCRRHHRAVHEEGFRVVLGKDDSIRFYTPRGKPVADTPVAPELPAKAVTTLRRDHEERGLQIDASTADPSWRGETLDLSWALHGYRSIGREEPTRSRRVNLGEQGA